MGDVGNAVLERERSIREELALDRVLGFRGNRKPLKRAGFARTQRVDILCHFGAGTSLVEEPLGDRINEGFGFLDALDESIQVLDG